VKPHFLAVSLLLATPAFAQTSHQTITVRHDDAPLVQGSGSYAREARPTAAFTEIEASGAERLEIVVGDARSVEVEIDDNLLQHLTTRVEKGVLKIGSRGSFRVARAPVVRITLPRLAAIRTSGSGDAEIRGLVGGDLTLVSRGSGGFRVPGGRVDRLTLDLSGSGETDLTRLDVRDATVDVLGSGTARVRATDAITARVSGSGDLIYSGPASNVAIRTTGSGSARRID
jgi:hypothetical protein